MKQSDLKRFWDKVDLQGPNDCWEWTACFASGGYGLFWINGKNVGANRIALQIKLGRPLRRKECALHDCPKGDNKKCVNPDHLWLGNLDQNNKDMAAKGRSARGEGHGCAKLTADDVSKIRELHEKGGVTLGSLAKKFGVSRPMVGYIVARKNWRHI